MIGLEGGDGLISGRDNVNDAEGGQLLPGSVIRHHRRGHLVLPGVLPGVTWSVTWSVTWC